MKKAIIMLNPDHGIPEDVIRATFSKFGHEVHIVIVEIPDNHVIPPPPHRAEKCKITSNAHVTKGGLERDILREYTLLGVDGYNGWSFRIRICQNKVWCAFSVGGVDKLWYLLFYDDVTSFLNALGRITGPRSAIRTIRTLVLESRGGPMSHEEVIRRMNWNGKCPNQNQKEA